MQYVLQFNKSILRLEDNLVNKCYRIFNQWILGVAGSGVAPDP